MKSVYQILEQEGLIYEYYEQPVFSNSRNIFIGKKVTIKTEVSLHIELKLEVMRSVRYFGGTSFITFDKIGGQDAE